MKRDYHVKQLRYWTSVLREYGMKPDARPKAELRAAGHRWRQSFDSALAAGAIERSGRID